MAKIIRLIYSHLPNFFKVIRRRIKSSNIFDRIVKGAFWSLAGSLFSRGLMLIASILVARILGQTEYGELGIIKSTVNMFVVFAGFGLGMTATKYIAELKVQNKERAGKIIGLSTLFAGISGFIVSLFIFILAPIIAEKTINAPHLVFELRIGAVMLFFSALNGSQVGILAGFEAFKSIAKINLIAGLMSFPVQIGFTFLWGVTGSIVGFGVNFLLLWVLGVLAVRRETFKHAINVNFRNSFDERTILIKFSLPALLSGLLVSPIMWICNTLLVRQPNGFNEMAIFDAANQWRILILFIPGLLSKIVLPLLSDPILNSGNYFRIIKINIIINILISCIISVGIFVFSAEIMRAYGTGFTEGKYVVVILAVSAIFVSANNVIGQVLASKDKMWDGLVLNFIWGIVLIGSSYFLIKEGMGALGLAISFLIAYIFHTITQSIYIFKTNILKQ